MGNLRTGVFGAGISESNIRDKIRKRHNQRGGDRFNYDLSSVYCMACFLYRQCGNESIESGRELAPQAGQIRYWTLRLGVRSVSKSTTENAFPTPT